MQETTQEYLKKLELRARQLQGPLSLLLCLKVTALKQSSTYCLPVHHIRLRWSSMRPSDQPAISISCRHILQASTIRTEITQPKGSKPPIPLKSTAKFLPTPQPHVRQSTMLTKSHGSRTAAVPRSKTAAISKATKKLPCLPRRR